MSRRIPQKEIDYIYKLNKEHPEWSYRQIAREVQKKFGNTMSDITVKRYITNI